MTMVRENDIAELLGEARAELAAYRDHVQLLGGVQ
jgi:hypothetical protein